MNRKKLKEKFYNKNQIKYNYNYNSINNNNNNHNNSNLKFLRNFHIPMKIIKLLKNQWTSRYLKFGIIYYIFNYL